MELTEDEKVLRGLLQFFLCADARRPSNSDAPLNLKYRDLILTAFEPAVKRKDEVPSAKPDSELLNKEDEDTAKGAEQEQASLQVLDLEDEDAAKGAEQEQASLQVLDLEDEDTAKGAEQEQPSLQVLDLEDVMDADAEGTPDKAQVVGEVEIEEGQSTAAPKTTAERVAEAVDATQAAEAAEAEIEAIMREEVLCRAILDPEGEARRRRIQARKAKGRKGLRWNFAGRASRGSNDRFREHEVDLESRRKLAFRHRGRFRGPIEDQGDERQHANLAKQREVTLSLTAMPGATVDSLHSLEAPVHSGLPNKRGQKSKAQRRLRTAPKRRLPPIDFPELPILIADHEDQDMFPMLSKARRTAALAVQTQRKCRKARAQELETLHESLAQELQSVEKERRDAARELCQSCVAEAEAVEELQKALTAAFGTVID